MCLNTLIKENVLLICFCDLNIWTVPFHHLVQEDQHLRGALNDLLAPLDRLLLWVLLLQVLPENKNKKKKI